MPIVDPFEVQQKESAAPAPMIADPLDVQAQQQQESSWLDVATSTLKVAPAKLAEGMMTAAGLIERNSIPALVDKYVLGKDKELDPEIFAAANVIADWSDRQAPEVGEAGAKYYLYSALTSVFQQLPLIGAAFATKNPSVALYSMGASAAGQKYNELKKKGYDERKAQIAAAGYGVAEAIGEKIPLKILMNPKYGLLKTMLFSAATEQPSELVTEALQIGIDMGYLNENQSWADVKKRIKDVIIVTGISSPLLVGGTYPMKRSAVKRYQAQQRAAEGATPQDEARRAREEATGQPMAEAGTSSPVTEPPSEAAPTTIESEVMTNGQEMQREEGRIDEGRDEGGQEVTPTAQTYEQFIKAETGETVEEEPEKPLAQAFTDRDYEVLAAWAKTFDKSRTFAEAIGEPKGDKSGVWAELGFRSARDFWDQARRVTELPRFEQDLSEFVTEDDDGFIYLNDGGESATLAELETLKEKFQALRAASKQALKDAITQKKENLKTFYQNRVAGTERAYSTIKARIRAITGQTRVDTLVPEMEALKAAMQKAQTASREAYRAGKKKGTLTERERAKAIMQQYKARQALLKEARNLKAYLKAAGKKAARSALIDADHKTVIRKVIEGNGDALQAFIANESLSPSGTTIPQDQIDMLLDTDPTAMTMEHLRNQASIVKQLIWQGRATRMLAGFNERVALADVVQEITDSIGENYRLSFDQPTTSPETPSGRSLSKREEFRDTVSSLHNILRKVEYICEAADGFKRFGPVWRNVFGRMVDAEKVSLRRSMEIQKGLNAAIDIIREDMPSIMDVTNRYEVDGTWLTKEEAIMVALNAGNEGNLQRLKKGYKYSDEKIQAIIDSLNDKEKRFVQAIFDLVNAQEADLSKVYRELTGEIMKKVEGQYFPIITDKELSQQAAERALESDLFSQFVSRAFVERGMTKSRVGGKDAPLLSFSVIAKHLTDVNHFVAYAVPVRDVQRVITHPTFKAAMVQSVGENAYGQLMPWLKHIAHPYHEALQTWDRIAGRLRRNASIAILGWSLSVAIVQPTAVFQAINRVGPWKTTKGFAGYYWEGAKDLWHHQDRMEALIYDMSPFMALRTQNFDADLRQLMEKDKAATWQGESMIKKSYYALMAFTDRMVTLPTWWAAYHEELKATGDQARAIDTADQTVRETQGSAMPKDLAEVQRGNNTRKLFVMFYSYFSSTYNEMTKSVDMVREGKAGKMELMKSFWWLVFLPALFSTLLKKREETTPTEVGKSIVGFGLGSIPIVGSFVNAALGNYEFRPTPVAAVGTEITKTLWSKSTPSFLKHGVMAFGYLRGIPSRQITLTAETIWDAIDRGDIEPFNAVYAEQKKGGGWK